MTTSGLGGTKASRPISRVAVLGLGLMGAEIAANIARATFPVVGYDPVTGPRLSKEQSGYACAGEPREAIAGSDCVVLSLPSEDAFDQAIRQIERYGEEGAVVVDASTLAIDVKERAAERLAVVGLEFLDCPVSGSAWQAKQGELTVYASGNEEAISRVRPVLETYARAIHVIGAVGFGMRMKLMSNLLIAIHNIATAEALRFGEALGIDAALGVKVLTDGASTSRMLEIRGPIIRDRSWEKPGMKVSVFQKDMRLIAAELSRLSVAAPTFNATIPVYNAAVGAGHGEHDTAAVYAVLRRMAGAESLEGTPP